MKLLVGLILLFFNLALTRAVSVPFKRHSSQLASVDSMNTNDDSVLDAMEKGLRAESISSTESTESKSCTPAMKRAKSCPAFLDLPYNHIIKLSDGCGRKLVYLSDKICINPDESCLAMGLDADAFRLNTESCDYPRVQLREGGTVGSKTLVEKYIRHKGKWYKYDSYYVRVTEIVQNVRRHNSRRRSGSVVGAVPNTNVEYVYNRGGDECMTRVYIGCAAGTFVGAFITGLVIVVTHM